jgi:site-specific recombinase XerD
LQPNGKRISSGTIANYSFTLKLIRKFCLEKGFTLRIKSARWLNSQELKSERNYWRKFYQKFTTYLYGECGYFDNYVGQTIKNIRVFFNYLNKDRILGVGDFHKQFYVRKEEISIFPLTPEELNFLTHNQPFEQSLSKRMREVKDFFVFGCTVALRFSDLNTLKAGHIRQINGSSYLIVRSKKTNIDTLVRLPQYAVDILSRYGKLKKRLLPRFNISNINKFIKRLLEQADHTSCLLTRNKLGNAVEISPKISIIVNYAL